MQDPRQYPEYIQRELDDADRAARLHDLRRAVRTVAWPTAFVVWIAVVALALRHV